MYLNSMISFYEVTKFGNVILGSLMRVTIILPALEFLQWMSKGQLIRRCRTESAGGEQTQRITKQRKKTVKKETNGRARI